MLTFLPSPLLRGLALLLLALPASAFAQPETWTVNPSAFEFSMTVTFTVTVNGTTGAAPYTAAIFDATGACRGVAENSYLNGDTYVGMMLVYANSGTQTGLSAQVFDPSTETIWGATNTFNFTSNATLGSLSAPYAFNVINGEIAGCTDPSACNFNPDASLDNGSCTYPDCSDPNACNFNDAAACPDDGLCTYPEPDYDCEGSCLADWDGDGICDGFEIPGCTDENACNFNAEATDADCSCTYPVYPFDCAGQCYLDTDGDGVCDGFEIAGCTDENACNFAPDATEDDGGCVYCCFAVEAIGEVPSGWQLTVAPHATATLNGQPHTTYRLSLTTPSPDDRVLGVLGSGGSTVLILAESGFYQHPDGGLFPHQISAAALTEDAELAYDSWVTIGIEGPAGEGELPPSTLGSAVWSNAFEFGDNLYIGGTSNAGWVVSPSASNAQAGPGQSVLLAQLTTVGALEGQVNVRVLPAGEEVASDLVFTFASPSCGCMDADACNYAAEALHDDGSCTFPESGLDCAGTCMDDSDGDGVCDANEILGCQTETADNFDPLATDSGTCMWSGCTYPAALNFNVQATADDGSCTFPDGSDFAGCADLDANGLVGVGDLLIILSQFGDWCE